MKTQLRKTLKNQSSVNRFLTCLTLIFLSSSIFSQTVGRLDSMRISLQDSSIESSIKWHFRIADRYYTKHEMRDSQRINIERGMKLAYSISDTFNIAGGFLDLGYVEMKEMNFSLADSFLTESFELHEASNYPRGLGMVYLARAALAEREGFPEKIVGLTILAKEKFELSGDERGVVSCLANLGQQFMEVEQYTEALKYLNLCYEKMEGVLSVSQRSNVIHTLTVAHWNYFESANDTSHLETALQLIQEGINLTEEKKLIYWQLKFKLLDAAADLYNKDFQVAIAKCNDVVKEGKRIKTAIPVSDAYKKLADANQEIGNYQMALQFADSVIFYGKKLNRVRLKRDGLKRKYLANKGLKNYKSTVKSLEEYKLINDSLVNVEAVAKLKEIEQRYESTKKEKEILALSQESEKLKQTAKLKQEEIKNKNLMLLIFGLLGLSGIAFFYVFYQRKILKEKKRSEEIQRQLWRSQINPHFLFNALNSIQRFYIEGKTEKGNEFLADFGDLLRKILDRSTKSMVSISEEVEFLKLYIDLEKRRLDKPLDYNIELSEELKDFEYLIPALLLQPVVENAIRHGIAKSDIDGKMNINISKTENGIKVKVVDNGIGFKKSQTVSKSLHQSMGLELVKERIDKIGDFSIDEIKDSNGKTQGTKVQIFIKINDK